VVAAVFAVGHVRLLHILAYRQNEVVFTSVCSQTGCGVCRNGCRSGCNCSCSSVVNSELSRHAGLADRRSIKAVSTTVYSCSCLSVVELQCSREE